MRGIAHHFAPSTDNVRLSGLPVALNERIVDGLGRRVPQYGYRIDVPEKYLFRPHGGACLRHRYHPVQIDNLAAEPADIFQ